MTQTHNPYIEARRLGADQWANAERLYDRWERLHVRPLLRRSSERLPSLGPARFGIRVLADELEARLRHHPDDAAWSAVIGEGYLQRLSAAVIAFTALPDDELAGYRPQSRWTVPQVRTLVLDQLTQIWHAVARRSIAGVTSRILDLQMMLDPDVR